MKIKKYVSNLLCIALVVLILSFFITLFAVADDTIIIGGNSESGDPVAVEPYTDETPVPTPSRQGEDGPPIVYPEITTPFPTLEPTPAPTFDPSGNDLVIIKNPLSETVLEGTSTTFTAKAEGAIGHQWFVLDQNGKTVSSDQWQYYNISVQYADADNTKLQISYCCTAIDGFSFYCEFFDDSWQPHTTEKAVLLVQNTPHTYHKVTDVTPTENQHGSVSLVSYYEKENISFGSEIASDRIICVGIEPDEGYIPLYAKSFLSDDSIMLEHPIEFEETSPASPFSDFPYVGIIKMPPCDMNFEMVYGQYRTITIYEPNSDNYGTVELFQKEEPVSDGVMLRPSLPVTVNIYPENGYVPLKLIFEPAYVEWYPEIRFNGNIDAWTTSFSMPDVDLKCEIIYAPEVCPGVRNLDGAIFDFRQMKDDYLNSQSGCNSTYNDLNRVDKSAFITYIPSAAGVLPSGIVYSGSSLILEDTVYEDNGITPEGVTIRHFFTLEKDVDIQSLHFQINGFDAEPVKRAQYYTVDVERIPFSALDIPQTISVFDDNCKWSLDYSVFSYCYKALTESTDTNLHQLVKSMFNYYLKAQSDLVVEDIPPVSSGFFAWPFPNHTDIIGKFGYDDTTGGYHTGIDIDGFQSEDAQIVAADGGTVILAEYYGAYGNCVIIDHGDGRATLYAHLNSMYVSAGSVVAQGDKIGLVGMTGNAENKGVHLHFEVLIDGSQVDPLDYIGEYPHSFL